METAGSDGHGGEAYSPQLITLLEGVWGEGYLSPGGRDEVARILAGVDLTGSRVLDIGCGAGGIDIELITAFGCDHVTGVDVEAGVLRRARELVAAHSLADRIDLIQVDPGPLPFAADCFDVVFAKESFLHVEDKLCLMQDLYRLLKPGGYLLASDWLMATEQPSPQMSDYMAAEGLGFCMASARVLEQAMAAAGFIDVRITSRNAWYRQQAREELRELECAHATFSGDPGFRVFMAHNIELWKQMIGVLDSGEHCPSHLYARKPR